MSHLGTTQGPAWNAQTHAPRRIGWARTLRDGSIVHLRPITREDAPMELEFLSRLSPEMRSLRFLGLIKEPCPDVARQLTDLDPAHSAGFAAVISDEGRDRQIGAAHFRASSAGDGCDCSVTVSDEWQNRGVGSALMRLLIEAAKARGIRHMRAFAPAQPDGSQHLAATLGFRRRLDLRDPAVAVYHLDLWP